MKQLRKESRDQQRNIEGSRSEINKTFAEISQVKDFLGRVCDIFQELIVNEEFLAANPGEMAIAQIKQMSSEVKNIASECLQPIYSNTGAINPLELNLVLENGKIAQIIDGIVVKDAKEPDYVNDKALEIEGLLFETQDLSELELTKVAIKNFSFNFKKEVLQKFMDDNLITHIGFAPALDMILLFNKEERDEICKTQELKNSIKHFFDGAISRHGEAVFEFFCNIMAQTSPDFIDFLLKIDEKGKLLNSVCIDQNNCNTTIMHIAIENKKFDIAKKIVDSNVFTRYRVQNSQGKNILRLAVGALNEEFVCNIFDNDGFRQTLKEMYDALLERRTQAQALNDLNKYVFHGLFNNPAQGINHPEENVVAAQNIQAYFSRTMMEIAPLELRSFKPKFEKSGSLLKQATIGENTRNL